MSFFHIFHINNRELMVMFRVIQNGTWDRRAQNQLIYSSSKYHTKSKISYTLLSYFQGQRNEIEINHVNSLTILKKMKDIHIN